jgi:POT family proton-dependent oligopeptide transporter
MTVAEATPELRVADRNDRAFLGHPKGLGYLGFTEACERFSYYSMQTLLVLYMVNYLLVPGRMEHVLGLDWLRGWHYLGLEAQPLSSAIFGDYTSLVYLTPILGGIIADKLTGRRIALIAGALMMALGHFLMAFENAFLFALLCLIVGVGLFKGNIATQVGELYSETDLRRAMAFQIFYIFINVSVIAAPLISGTLGQKVGWHYGFGCAGIVMVLGLIIYLWGQKSLPADLAVAARPQGQLIGRAVGGAVGIALLAVGWLAISGYLFSGWLIYILPAFLVVLALYFMLARSPGPEDRFRFISFLVMIVALEMLLIVDQLSLPGSPFSPWIKGIVAVVAIVGTLYFFLTRSLDKGDRSRVIALMVLIPMLGISLLTNQEIFNAYLVWGDQHFDLTLLNNTSSWLITLDAALSFSMLVAVALFWKWWSLKRKEPDEISKIIIGSLFTIVGGLCLFMAAATQPADGKIGLFWPFLFHLFNSIGFAHVLPISLALFSKIAPKAIAATVIGLYYLAFFAANKIVGYIGGLYSSLPTTTFWLIHIGSAVIGLVAFVLFKAFMGKRLASHAPEEADVFA